MLDAPPEARAPRAPDRQRFPFPRLRRGRA
jgi:hypothetical protein